jgi:leucoanthocyanidin reductase
MNGHSPNAWEGSRVMIIGSMGFIGGFIAEASLECGHPTYLLIRPELASLSKASTIKSLQHRGATTIYVTNAYLVAFFIFTWSLF